MSLKIAFGFKKGSGKDTAVDYLLNEYGGSRVAFAQPLKEILEFAQLTCGFAVENDRKFLQYVGTEWARVKYPNVWVDIAMRDMGTGNRFVSDLRFPNELEACKKAGFMCVHVVRDVRDVRDNDYHISETALDGVEWDATIYNNGTFEELYTSLDTLVKVYSSR
jgi:hypothetical protein